MVLSAALQASSGDGKVAGIVETVGRTSVNESSVALPAVSEDGKVGRGLETAGGTSGNASSGSLPAGVTDDSAGKGVQTVRRPASIAVSVEKPAGLGAPPGGQRFGVPSRTTTAFFSTGLRSVVPETWKPTRRVVSAEGLVIPSLPTPSRMVAQNSPDPMAVVGGRTSAEYPILSSSVFATDRSVAKEAFKRELPMTRLTGKHNWDLVPAVMMSYTRLLQYNEQVRPDYQRLHQYVEENGMQAAGCCCSLVGFG